MSENGKYGQGEFPVTVIVRTMHRDGTDEESKRLKNLETCLKSIVNNTPKDLYHVIVVDNNGCGKLGFVPEDRIDVVATYTNYGAVRATNIGLQFAMLDPSKYILVLDDDTEVPEGDAKWLDRWIEHFEGDDSVGAVGATSDYVSGLQNVASTPRTYTKEAKEAVEGGPGVKGPVDADWLISFACMYSKRALRCALPPWIGEEEMKALSKTAPERWAIAMGGMLKSGYQPITYLWDERYTPGNWEDIDISIRISMAGYRLRIARDIYIHHTGSQTFAEMDFSNLIMENQKKGLEKWGPNILAQCGLAQQVTQ